jgi:hypothetical protein
MDNTENRFKSHQEFFAKVGDDCVNSSSFCETSFPVTVEEMYHHFKSRMIHDLLVRGSSCQGVVYGDLEDK